MPTERVFDFDVAAEIDRLFDDSSIPADGQPTAVILMGGPGAGKTTIRKQKYSSGYVIIDAADIFLSLSCGELFPFPEALQEPMELVGRLVTHRALSERRNIVTEIIGAEVEQTHQLVDALKSIDYQVQLAAITCDIQEGMRRNMSRGDDNISAYCAEPFQRAWIIDTCNELANDRKVNLPD
jgi:chloramphenicol 3-O-phosphotransferase